MFGLHIYNYAFIDKNDTGLLWDTQRSGPLTDGCLLSGPPGPFVPGEVCPVGLHPRLWGPLLCYVVAPTWEANMRVSDEATNITYVHFGWVPTTMRCFVDINRLCVVRAANRFHGAINRVSQFPLLRFNKLSQMVWFSESKWTKCCETENQPIHL